MVRRLDSRAAFLRCRVSMSSRSSEAERMPRVLLEPPTTLL